MSWHKKVPEVLRPHPTLSCKERGKSRPYDDTCKIALGGKRDKPLSPANTISRPYKEIIAQRVHEKNISNNRIATTYKVTPENSVPDPDKTKKDSSGWKLALSIIFCLLGILGAIIVVGIVASAPFFTGTSLPLAKGLSYALLPLMLLFASLIFGDAAMKNGHNRGLIVCMILDCILFLVLVFSVFSLK